MKTAKGLEHTAGPWQIGKISTTITAKEPVVTSSSIQGDGGVNNKDYFGGSLIAESVLRKENAILIAAAPDMYQVLLKLASSSNDVEFDQLMDNVDEILSNIHQTNKV